MAILKMKKIIEMNEKDLLEKLRELQLELAKERASAEVGGTVKSPGRIKEVRRAIARIKTYDHQKKIAPAAKKPKPAAAKKDDVKKEKRGGSA